MFLGDSLVIIWGWQANLNLFIALVQEEKINFQLHIAADNALNIPFSHIELKR